MTGVTGVSGAPPGPEDLPGSRPPRAGPGAPNESGTANGSRYRTRGGSGLAALVLDVGLGLLGLVLDLALGHLGVGLHCLHAVVSLKLH